MHRKISYLKAVVIVHGKSEKQICEYIKVNLRIKMEIESDKKGEKAIQITSLLKRTLNNNKFRSIGLFKKAFKDIEFDHKTKKISDKFKIFIIMDTDDCDENLVKSYLSKEMFRNHWAYEYIVPIHNSPNLEDVLVCAGIKFKKTGKNQKKEYLEIFPTDPKYIKSDTIQVKDFCNYLEKNKNSNLDIFINFCLESIE